LNWLRRGSRYGESCDVKLNLGFNVDGKLSSGRDRRLLRKRWAALQTVS